MRKVLSFVLVLSLVLGSFSMAFAATPKDVVGLPSEDAVAVLSDLGVVSGYDDGTYKPENIVTRAEMAVLVIRALGLTDYVTNAAKSSFSDMAGYGWAEGYIAYAQSLGFVSGYPDGTFKPGKTVSYDEAASMLVRALGYTTDSLTGTWPANFVVKAKALGILDGIKSGAAGANRGDVAIMLYQTLDCPIGTVDKEGKWEAHKDKNDNPNDTMLGRLGADLVNGGNDFVLSPSQSNSAVINVSHLVGALVKAYENKDGDIIAIAEVNSTFLTGSYDLAKGTFKADGVTYNLDSADVDYVAVDAAGDKTANTTPAGLVNGQTTTTAITSSVLDAFSKVTIAAKVSGKTIKEVYSANEWTAVEVFKFASVMLDDESLNGYNFALDDNDEIDLAAFALVGAESLEDIAKDNVVSVYLKGTAVTSDIARVEVGTKTAEGKVTMKQGNDFTIGGKVYTKSSANGVGASPNVGDTGVASLDYSGEIAFWKADDSSSGNYAVVTDEFITAGRDSTIVLLTKDGKETEFVLKDGATTETTGAGITTPGQLVVGDLIEYAVNKDSKITKMTKLAWASAGTDELSATGNTFGSNLVDAGVVVFTFDKATSTTAGVSYDVAKLADVKKKESLTNAKVYVSSKVKVMFVNTNDIGGSDSTYAVINRVTEAVTADDDDVFYVTGFADGKEFKAYTDDRTLFGAAEWTTTASALQGIYELKLNSDGVITGATYVSTAAVAGDGNIELAAVNGTVTDKDGSYSVKIGGTWYTIDTSAKIYEFDATKALGKTYSLTNIAAIKDGSGATTSSQVTLYKVDEDSEVYDIVVIEK